MYIFLARGASKCSFYSISTRERDCIFQFFFFKEKLLFKKIFYLFFIGEEEEKERKRNINVWLPLVLPLLGTWLATHACALTGNQTGDRLVLRSALNPLSHTSQEEKLLLRKGDSFSFLQSLPPPPLSYFSAPSILMATCWYQLTNKLLVGISNGNFTDQATKHLFCQYSPHTCRQFLDRNSIHWRNI